MTEINFRTPVVANGTYLFPQIPAGLRRTIEFAGSFGGGTLQVGYLGLDGTFVPFSAEAGGAALEFTANDAIVVDTPATGRFVAYLTGATSPSIQFGFTDSH